MVTELITGLDVLPVVALEIPPDVVVPVMPELSIPLVLPLDAPAVLPLDAPLIAVLNVEGQFMLVTMNIVTFMVPYSLRRSVALTCSQQNG